MYRLYLCVHAWCMSKDILFACASFICIVLWNEVTFPCLQHAGVCLVLLLMNDLGYQIWALAINWDSTVFHEDTVWMGTRERVLAPKRLQAAFHLDLIGCIQTATGSLAPSGTPNPFQGEISHWCKHSFGHNALSNTALFLLWSFMLTNLFFISFWSLLVKEAEQDF